MLPVPLCTTSRQSHQKLIIVLSCHVLLNALEYADPTVEKQRNFDRFLLLDSIYSHRVKSLLKDLLIDLGAERLD
jgi:hypothetical protein